MLAAQTSCSTSITSLKRIKRPTSVAANKLADATMVTLPVFAEAYKVVVVSFSSRYGPSVKSMSASVKLVAVVLVSFAGS